MANLLDMLLGDQSNLFQRAGLGQPSGEGGGSTPSRPSVSSAAPTSAPVPDRRGGGTGGGVSGVLGSLFGGGNDPRLTPEENAAVNKKAALRAGIAMMAASWGEFPNPGASIKAGLEAGSAAADKHMNAILEQRVVVMKEAEKTRIAKIRAAVYGGDIDLTNPIDRLKAFSILAEAGDTQGVKDFVDYSKTFPDPIKVETGEEVILWNPLTGKEMERWDLPDAPLDTHILNRGNVIDLIDKQTGEVIKSYRVQAAPGATRKAMNQDFQRLSTMQGNYQKEAKGIREALQLGDAAVRAGDSAAADQTRVMALNKLLDPNSVVRESEFARVAEIGGYGAKMVGFWNKVFAGGVLPPEVRDQIDAEILRLVQEKGASLQEINGRFGVMAQEFAVNPNFIFNSDIKVQSRILAANEAGENAFGVLDDDSGLGEIDDFFSGGG